MLFICTIKGSNSAYSYVEYQIIFRFIIMNHLTLTLLLTLAVLSTAQNSYANFTTLQNPHQFNSVVWASDLKFVMLYGEQAL